MSNLPGKRLFPFTQEVTYLDTAAEGVPPSTLADAYGAYMRAKFSGSTGRPALYEMEHAATASAAKLLGADPDDIALLSSASEALNTLANSIEWREGDEVLVSDSEFPTNVITWLRLKEKGVKLVVIPGGGVPSLEAYTSRIHARTRVVCVSHVSYKTGSRIPFTSQLAEAAHAVGAIFCLDVTQSLGRVPVSLEGVDFLIGSSYKWLLASHGVGIVYFSKALREKLNPGVAGWYSVGRLFFPERFEQFEFKSGANRLQTGMPNFPALYTLDNGIRFLLETGVETIYNELAPVMAKLRAGLVGLGLDVLTAEGPEYGSGIVSFAHSQPEEIGRKLAENQVIVWAGDGRVRSAVHLYNDQSDVDRYLSVLAGLV